VADASLKLRDAAGIHDWILRRLGAPQLLIELDQGQLDICVEDATRWFASKKGVVRTGTLQLQANVALYQLPEDVGHVTGLAAVEPTPDLSLALGGTFLLPEQQLPYSALGYPASGGVLSSYVQSLQYIETSRRVFGRDPDFEFDQSTGRLRVSPTPTVASRAEYTYKSDKFTLDQLTELDHNLLKRYALAVAKEIVGRIRSKRAEHPGAQGQVRLDGDTLLKESADDREKLDAEILATSAPLSFLTG